MGDQGYMVGGYAGHSNDGPQKTFKRYDLSDDAWIDRAQPAYYFGIWGGASCEENGYLWVGMLSWPAPNITYSLTMQRYNINSNGWTTLTALLVREAGGCCPPPFGGYIYSEHLKYDFNNDIWKASWWNLYFRYLVGSYVYGVDGNSNVHQRYNPDTNTVSLMTSIPDVANDDINGWGDDNYGYVERGANYNMWFDRYDVAGNIWATKSARPGTQGCSRATFFLEGNGHSLGGRNPSSIGVTTHARYNSSTESWESKASCFAAYDQLAFAPPDNLAPNAPTSLSVSTT